MRSSDATEKVSLGEIAAANPESVKGLAPTDLIKYIDISCVNSSYEIASDIEDMPLESAPSRAKRLVRAGDILISNVRTERRSFCVIPDALDGSVASTGFTVLRADPSKVDPRFLWAIIRDPAFTSYAINRQTGSNYPAIKASDVSEYEIFLPSLEEQRRIGNILSCIDSKIELNRQMEITLDEISQALFLEQFVDPVKTDSELPTGWKVGTVNDLCDRIVNGGTPKKMEKSYWEGGSIPWFKTGELNNGVLPAQSSLQITEKGLKESSCKLLDPGTVLIAIYAAPTVGRLGILSDKAATNQACTALVPKEKVGTWFLFYVLKSLNSYFNGISSGSAQQNISKQIVQDAPCTIPSAEAITEFNGTVSKTADLIGSLFRERNTLTQIRDELVPKLVQGQLAVSDSHSASESVSDEMKDFLAEDRSEELLNEAQV